MDVKSEANKIIERLATHHKYAKFLDQSFEIPDVYKGDGETRLIIVGQDPTVEKYESRGKVKCALNLDRPSNSLYNYIVEICNGLGITLSNIYATNYFKNFFIEPPTKIRNIDVFKEFKEAWFPLLIEELKQFPHIPVLTLGKPILSVLINNGSLEVRDYWGYNKSWKLGLDSFLISPEDHNTLGRVIFPFPHQPTRNTSEFYRTYCTNYLEFFKGYLDNV